MRRAETSPSIDSALRRRSGAFTLLETVLSVAVMTVILGAIALTIVSASNAVSVGRDENATRAAAAAVLSETAEELRTATRIVERSATGITLEVPDRDGDGAPDTIQYDWPAHLQSSLLLRRRQRCAGERCRSPSLSSLPPHHPTAVQVGSRQCRPADHSSSTADQRPRSVSVPMGTSHSTSCHPSINPSTAGGPSESACRQPHRVRCRQSNAHHRRSRARLRPGQRGRRRGNDLRTRSRIGADGSLPTFSPRRGAAGEGVVVCIWSVDTSVLSINLVGGGFLLNLAEPTTPSFRWCNLARVRVRRRQARGLPCSARQRRANAWAVEPRRGPDDQLSGSVEEVTP